MLNIPTVTVDKTTLDADTDTVTLTVASPASFTARHLLVRINAISDATADGQTVKMRFNGDSGNNYNQQQLKGVSTTETATRFNSRADIPLYDITDTADAFSGGEVLIPDAFSTRSHKASVGQFGKVEEGLYLIAGRWANTAAITSVTLLLTTGKFAALSDFEVCVVDESLVFDEQILTSDGALSVTSITDQDGDLVVIGNLRSDIGDAASDTVNFAINDDTTDGNYSSSFLRGESTTPSSVGVANDRNFGNVAGNTATAGAFGAFVASFPHFNGTVGNKAGTALAGIHSSSSVSYAQTHALIRDNTEAITRIDLIQSAGSAWLAGSMLSTYLIPNNSDLIGTASVGSETGRIELGSDAGSVTFSSIPSSYDHLELSIYARSDRTNVNDDLLINFNGDTTWANYKYERMNTNPLYASSAGSGFPSVTSLTGGSATADYFAAGTITILNYVKDDRDKHFFGTMGSANYRHTYQSNRWENTSAITSILLDSTAGTNLVTGTVFELRGISSDIPALTPASDIEKVNTIALADIQTFNGITVANAEKLNTITF